MTRAALIPALALILSRAIWCVEDGYVLKYDISKEALSAIYKATDTTTQLVKLLQQYTSDKAEECKEQLAKQNYDDTIKVYVYNLKSQIEYIDKALELAVVNCGTDTNCKQEASDDNNNDLQTLQTKAKVYLAAMKKQLLQKQKDFMNQCVK